MIVPDVEITNEKIDFGSVLCSHCVFMYVKLSNIKAVECEWEARFFKTAKDSNCFRIEPELGASLYLLSFMHTITASINYGFWICR